MSTLSIHVLDTATGRPAQGLAVRLEKKTDAGFELLGQGQTNADGRLKDLAPGPLAPGVYRITFDTGAWFSAQGTLGFYPEVPVLFEIRAADEHYHVPLLLSPYGFSTYRGS